MNAQHQESIKAHYEPVDSEEGLVAKVSRLLQARGDEKLDPSELKNLDQLHVRGALATEELAHLVDLRPGSRVLDAGCGMGGPARFLASQFAATVIGVDLTPSFIHVAEMLTTMTGLSSSVEFRVADLACLDMPDETFDVVWTQHVVMNIADREQVYKELRRVLKSGGKFAFYDVLAADAKPELLYPTPWAASPETSFLLNEDETRLVLGKAGLTISAWKDVTSDGLAWFARLATEQPVPTALSLPALIGPRFREMTSNFGQNLRDGRARLVMGVADAS